MPATESALNLLELHISLTEKPTEALRIGPTNNNVLRLPEIVCNDRLMVRLYFYASVSKVLTARKFPSGTVVGINAVQRDPIGEESLIIPGEFTLVDDATTYYEGTVDAATAQMLTLLEDTERAEIVINVQVSDIAGGGATERRTVAYFGAYAYKDAMDDGGAGADAAPEWLQAGVPIEGGTQALIGTAYKVRRGTAANWTSANPVLLAGEAGFETDTRKRKTGDGATAWTSLAYDSAPAESVIIKIDVPTQIDRFNLTAALVQNGDFVKQADTDALYVVIDQDSLDSEAGYTELIDIPISAIVGLQAALDAKRNIVQVAYDAGTGGGSVTLDFNNGHKQRYAANAAITSFNAPSNPVAGAELRVTLTASSANRDFTPHGDILLASDSSLTFPKTMLSGKEYTMLLERNVANTAWKLMAFIGGH